jgi:hypothetical protein
LADAERRSGVSVAARFGDLLKIDDKPTRNNFICLLHPEKRPQDQASML